jgi:serine/threonine protein kinase
MINFTVSDVHLQLNILIDDSGKAVLCDFGLSRIKADVTTRTTFSERNIAGSRNWMAPEQLMGGVPKKPCDIYAFGMTIYEVSTTSYCNINCRV